MSRLADGRARDDRRQFSAVMERVRTLLLELPPLLRDILVLAIDEDAGCEVVTEVDLTRMPGERAPDVVVLGLRADEDTTLVPALLARWPRAQVITVMQEGDRAVIHELQPRRRTLGQVSAPELVGMLRDAVEHSQHRSYQHDEDNDARDV